MNIETTLYSPLLMARWNKILTLDKPQQDLSKKYDLHLSTKQYPRMHDRLAAILASKIIPTGTVMRNIGLCPSTDFPWRCVHTNEDNDHVFQYQKGYITWEMFSKVLHKWGDQNKSIPSDNISHPMRHIIFAQGLDPIPSTFPTFPCF